jgi:hypothetical protein
MKNNAKKRRKDLTKLVSFCIIVGEGEGLTLSIFNLNDN